MNWVVNKKIEVVDKDYWYVVFYTPLPSASPLKTGETNLSKIGYKSVN